MKIKVSEADGAALDWLVAKCEGWTPVIGRNPYNYPVLLSNYDGSYSTDWTYGGPIIEREKMDIIYYPDGSHVDGGVWLAAYVTETQDIDQLGPTPLIAAMRCFVMSRLGDEVEIPEGLI